MDPINERSAVYRVLVFAMLLLIMLSCLLLRQEVRGNCVDCSRWVLLAVFGMTTILPLVCCEQGDVFMIACRNQIVDILEYACILYRKYRNYREWKLSRTWSRRYLTNNTFFLKNYAYVFLQLREGFQASAWDSLKKRRLALLPKVRRSRRGAVSTL